MASPPPQHFEPYRVLFPMGLGFALIGVGVWPLYAFGRIAHPGPLHIAVMIRGFEQCFVLGFLLTAMPAFTHGPRCHPLELGLAVTTMAVFGATALTGAVPVAEAAFLLSLLLIAVAGVRRVAGNEKLPPEEFLFVGFGLMLGLIGGSLLLATSLGAGPSLPPRFPERLLSLGMVLSLVVGVGSLLVPTFSGMRKPLEIPGVAVAHERRGRRLLYALVIVTFIIAFATELLGQPRIGAFLRAVTVTTMGLWVWKLTRLPRRDAPGFALWGSGWMILTGMWTTAVFPTYTLAGLHIVFIGGFALLTMGISTRVLVAHGKHPLPIERRVLDPWVVGLFLLAIVFRVRADMAPDRAAHSLGASGAFWLVAWLLWAVRAMPLVRVRPTTET